MRVILAIIGAIAGLSLAGGSHEMFGIVVGALAGFGAGELGAMRGKLQALEAELSSLRKALQAGRERESRPPAQQGDVQRPARSAQTTTSQPTAGAWEPYGVASPPVGASPGAPATRAEAPTGATNDTANASIDRPPSTAPAPAAARTRHVVQPHREDFVDAAVRVVREYFTGGNTLVRVGVIILFFGVAFLLRYAAEHSHVPIEFRLSGVALGGIILLVFGWWLRTKRAGYAMALQGGAVGILYLTVFAGLKMYSVLPAGAAFALLVVVAALSAALAVLQSSQAFAFLAVSGGFLAPILASTGRGDHVVLFSYYAILNGGILVIAWFKAWRPLNVLGFLFTFVIGTAWGVFSYQPQLFATTEPFLALFFLFYVAIAILFASRQPLQLRGYVDGTLVFGTPMVVFGLQSAMLHDRRFVLAFSALAVSALYLALATLLHRTRHASYRLLVESFVALGVLFLTLAVPLALDGRWSAATWALEGAALLWIGCRQGRRLPRAFGSLLQLAGGVIFLFDIEAPQGTVPILNSAFLGGAMVSAASVFCATMLERNRDRLARSEHALAPVLFCWGVLWWLFTGLLEIHRRIPSRFENAGGLLLMALTACLSSELVRRAKISFARHSALALLPMMIFYALLASVSVQHPFADGGWLSWPLVFAAFYFVCKRHEGEPGSALANALHMGSLWLLAALLSWQLYWWIDHGVAGGSAWPTIAWALVPAVLLFVLPKLKRWPFAPHRTVYCGIAALGLAFYLALWSVGANVMLPGNSYPLPFVPLLNPLDLAEFFVLLVLLRYWLFLRAARLADFVLIPQRPVFTGLAILAFIWLNAALLRSLHQLAGVPFEVPALLQSNLVETAISIFWTVIALTTMLVATRKNARVVWLTAAGLLGVVIAKLFLVDLSHVGTVERIVSFVGVGVMMLVIGYFHRYRPHSSNDPRKYMIAFLALVAATATLSTPKDFAYRMQVTGTADAAAYRVTLPLAVYQKVVHPDLADVRVFNGNAEQVAFAIERPVVGTIANAAVALSMFPLKDDSAATLDALRVTLESGKSAINVQASGGPSSQAGRINSYWVDGRALDVLVSALRLEWPEDAGDFAGRIRVEAGDDLSDWRVVAAAAPVANLHSTSDRLVEQRVEFAPAKARFWRLSWVGPAAPFALTAILGEPAKRSVDALHASMTVAAATANNVSTKVTPGEFEFDLGATPPVDRVNLELPEINTVVDVEILARGRPQDAWHTISHGGFYRLKSDGVELRNGPVSVSPTTDRYWLIRTDPRRGGFGTAAPRLSVEWIPHEVVFVARGAGPFYLAYGSRVAQSAAASLTMLPKDLAIVPAALSGPELSGGESVLQALAAPYPWKTPLLWTVLIAGAGLLAWMAFRLAKDIPPK